MTILLQAMDDAVVTSSNGKKVRLGNSIIMMTSNLGAEDMSANTLGFVESKVHDGAIDINAFFSPEFRNRLDGILRFKSLTKKTMESIIDKFIGQLNDQMKDKKINIKLDKKAKTKLLEEGFDSKMVARPLQRVINQRVKLPLSKKILFNDIKEKEVIINYDSETDSYTIGE